MDYNTALSAVENFDSLPADSYVRLPVVRALMGGRSAQSIYRDVDAGRLPAPVSLGPRFSAWHVGELRAALAAKKTSPDAELLSLATTKAQAMKAAHASVAARRSRSKKEGGHA